MRDPHVLGAVQFGGAALPVLSGLPHAVLCNSALDRYAVVELWAGAAPATTQQVGDVTSRHDGELLFGAVAAPLGRTDDALGAAAYSAYRSMLETLRATGYSHLLRVWNSIPDINVDDAGLERYRHFNLQRFRAFEEAKLPTHAGAPAATALGTWGGPLVLHFLATRTPPRAIENPRQVSAYHYPASFGPRAPNFSRAALWRGADAEQDVLFISGTASIVGHDSVHRGDVAAQTRETLANLEAVCAQARRAGVRGTLDLKKLALKVYMRHAQDLGAVWAELGAHGLDADAALYLQADICRAELLVEVEAVGAA